MGNTTSIEWADATLNTAWGCTKVSKGCDKCYMFRLSHVFGKSTDPAPRKPKALQQAIRKLGDPKIVFLNSMSDTFHESFPDEMIEGWFDELARTPHVYICLTKRPSRMMRFERSHRIPDNFWVGTSIEGKSAYHRLQPLRKMAHPTKFVSLEPLLESVKDIDLTGIHWVIVGGESDFMAPRKFEEQWAREIRDRCAAEKIPFFYKQSGGRKKVNDIWGTNILDGRTHLEMPEALKTKESTVIGSA